MAQKDEDRCEALTVMTEWKRLHKVDQRCPFIAKWRVQEKQLCYKHAMMESLAVCAENGFASRIFRPVISNPGGRVATVKDQQKETKV